jgi:hypothetical protein
MKIKLLVVFVFFTRLCAAQIDTSWSTFQSNNYKVSFPKTWRLDTSKAMGTEFYIFSPTEDEKDNFRENCNLIIQNLNDKNITLEKYKTISERQIKTVVAEPKLFYSSIKKTGNTKYYKIAYQMKQGKYKLMVTSLCFINNNLAYLISFTSEVAKYNLYKRNEKEILASFAFIK